MRSILSAMIICSVGLAFAAPAKQLKAIELAENGATAYKAGQYSAAINALQSANRLQPDPVLDINIGRCYEKMGKYSEALLHCKIALNDRSADSATRAAAQKCVARIQPKLARPKLKIESIPPGAAVRVDGQKMGITPWEGEVLPGRRQLDLELADYRPYIRSIVTEPAGAYSITGTLIPNSVGAMITVTSIPPDAQVSLDGQPVGNTPIFRMPVEVKSYTIEVARDGFIPQVMSMSLAEGTHLERTITLVPTGGLQLEPRKQWPAWLLIGAGVTMAAAGGYYGIKTLQNRSRARELATTSGSPSDLGKYRSAVDTFHASQVTADLLYVGALLSTTGGIFVLTWP